MNEWTPFHDRHADKIELVAGVDCWIWTGSIGRAGHGRVSQNGQSLYAHRLAYASFQGRDPDGLVRHLCGCSGCVRPSHLAEGTPADNSRDMALMGRSRSRITPADAAEIRRRYTDGVPLAEIAAEFGIANGTVYPIVVGKSFRFIDEPTRRALRCPPKLTTDDVREIRSLISSGVSQKEIGLRYNVAQSLISRINTRVRWGNVQ